MKHSSDICQCSSVETREGPPSAIRRRGALRRLGLLILSPLAGLRRALGAQKLALGLDKAEKLKTVGGSALLKIQGQEVLFIRESEDRIRAINPVCSHRKCTVEYKREPNRLVCPCHGSNYDLDGKVLNGPAEKPLTAYEASLDEPKTRVIFTLE